MWRICAFNLYTISLHHRSITLFSVFCTKCTHGSSFQFFFCSRSTFLSICPCLDFFFAFFLSLSCSSIFLFDCAVLVIRLLDFRSTLKCNLNLLRIIWDVPRCHEWVFLVFGLTIDIDYATTHIQICSFCASQFQCSTNVHCHCPVVSPCRCHCIRCCSFILIRRELKVKLKLTDFMIAEFSLQVTLILFW